MDRAERKVATTLPCDDSRADTSRKESYNSTQPSHDTRHERPTSISRITPQAHEHTQTLTEEVRDTVGRAKRHHHHRHRHRHHASESKHGATASDRIEKDLHLSLVKGPTSAPTAVPTHGVGESNRGYFEDRKGDQHNITYGSLHRYSIPRYRTAGCQRVLGLGRAHKILLNSESNTRVISEGHTDSGTRVKAQSLLAENVDRKNVPVLVSRAREAARDDGIELQRDYLALDSHPSRKRRRLERGASSQIEPGGHLTASQRQKPKPGASSETPDGSESDTKSSTSTTSSDSEADESFEQFRKDANQQKSVEFSRAVHDHPLDIDAWFALVEHQDAMLAGDRGITSRAPTNAEKRGMIDIKVSIYESALAKNKESKDNAGRERLVIGLLDEGSKIWDSTRLANRWKLVLKENPESVSLWVKYLNFQQSQFATFTYEQCKNAYIECFRIASPQQGESLIQIRIYILLRLTTFMKDAGYSEHATGIWQAMLEFNFFRPHGIDIESERRSFEDFWNSEVARVGEEGAKGWHSGSSPEVAPRSDTANLKIDGRHIFETWQECEEERTLNCRLPARTLDEVSEDDPYRVIISSDVMDYLFHATDLKDRDVLLNAFLMFCALPQLPAYEKANYQQWWTDAFLRKLEMKEGCSNPHSHPRSQIATPSSMSNFSTDTATMFAQLQYWFSCWQNASATGPATVILSFLHVALRQLVDGNPDNQELAEFVVSFELQTDPKEARKYAKALLKQRPSSLRLYNAFALVECQSGKYEAAERVWATALSMSRTFQIPGLQISILLWRTWIWMLLDRREPLKALALLLAIPDGEIDVDKLSQISNAADQALQSTALLKSRRLLQSSLSQAISLQQTNLLCHYADLLALLVYFSSRHSISAALAIYATAVDTSRNNVTRDSPTLELLHQSRARILHLHALTSSAGFRPAEVTSALAESVRLFPSNTIFLSLYHHHTQRSLLTDRLRTVIPTLNSAFNESAAKDSVIPLVFDIWSEILRPSYAGSTQHSIRAAFERAVETGKAGVHSVGIWKWYLLWELEVSEPETTILGSTSKTRKRLSRAQDVFYRGMRSCPWAKETYMVAFTGESLRLRDAIGFEGLRKIYETMVEKGIRIHVDVDNALEDWEQKQRDT